MRICRRTFLWDVACVRAAGRQGRFTVGRQLTALDCQWLLGICSRCVAGGAWSAQVRWESWDSEEPGSTIGEDALLTHRFAAYDRHVHGGRGRLRAGLIHLRMAGRDLIALCT
jgi:hypothetical protein